LKLTGPSLYSSLSDGHSPLCVTIMQGINAYRRTRVALLTKKGTLEC
jgi:hypothetical protein